MSNKTYPFPERVWVWGQNGWYSKEPDKDELLRRHEWRKKFMKRYMAALRGYHESADQQFQR